MYKIKYLIILVIICLLVAACAKESKNIQNVKVSSRQGTSVTNISIDNYFVIGRNQQIFHSIPRRIIVVGENETETLLALGAGQNILEAVAQNNRVYSMRPENALLFNSVRKCSNANLNMEYLTQQHPDLIIAQQCIFVRNRLDNTDYWNQHGIATLVPPNTNTPGKHFYTETVEKEMQFINDLGIVLDKRDQAKAIIDSTYKTIDEINMKTATAKKSHVMIIEFISSMISYDNTKLVGNMVEKIGGRVATTPAVIGFENVIKEDPDILFVVCSHMDYGACITKVLDNPALKDLKCMKNKRVYSIPLRFTYGASCRTEDGLKFLAERMYPDINAWSWK